MRLEMLCQTLAAGLVYVSPRQPIHIISKRFSRAGRTRHFLPGLSLGHIPWRGGRMNAVTLSPDVDIGKPDQQRIFELYDRGLYLQAFHAAEALAPLKQWAGTEAR